MRGTEFRGYVEKSLTIGRGRHMQRVFELKNQRNKRTGSSLKRTVFSRRVVTTLSIVALCLPTVFSGCKGGGEEFRRVLRGAAHSVGRSKTDVTSKQSPKDKKAAVALANKNSIKKCPKGAKLRGAPFPQGTSQWCEATSQDGKPLKHGQLRQWHKNGNLKVEATYQQGQFVGKMRKWFKNGRLSEETSYAEGERHGPSTIWNKDGSKKLQGNFRNGKKYGKFNYWAKGGRQKESGGYVDDLKYGTWTDYHRTGHVRSRVTWAEGKKNGPAVLYSRDGIIVSNESYQDDLPHGKWVTYYKKTGQMKSEGAYANGQRHGQWITYDRHGQVRKMMVYEKGAVVQQQGQYATASSRRRRKRYTKFGTSDILGAPPPIRRQAPAPLRPTPDKPQPVEKGSGWNRL